MPQPYDIPTRLRLAATLPPGSEARRAVLAGLYVAAGMDSFHTESGRLFRIKTTEYAKLLSEVLRVRGGQLGTYLRDETFLPDEYLSYVSSYGGTYKDRSPVGPRGPRPVDIKRAWDKLLDAIRKTVTPKNMSAGDYFLNMGDEYEDDEFWNWVQSASGDVSQSLEYALEGKALEMYDALFEALRTRNFTSSGYDNWSVGYRATLLKEIYADIWADAMMKAWQKIENDPTELARLKAMRAPRP
jgi:hypothetical protein